MADTETLGKAVDANHLQAEVEMGAPSPAVRSVAGHPISLLDLEPLDGLLAEVETAFAQLWIN